jgi:hypothetical protein
MGETGVALSGMPESPLWNPAALNDVVTPTASLDFDMASRSRLEKTTLLNTSSLRGRQLTYVGLAASGVAIFYKPLAHIRDQTITNPADPQRNFSRHDLSMDQFGVSMVSEKEGRSRVATGASLSYLRGSRGYVVLSTTTTPVVEFASGNGFSLDFGCRYTGDHWRTGLAVFNLPGIMYWNSYKADSLPILVRAGAALHPAPGFTLTTEYEKRFYRGNLPRPGLLHFGMEMTPLSWARIRVGTYGEDFNDSQKTTYTAGFSVASPKGLGADSAFRVYREGGERVYNYFLSITALFRDQS